MSNAKRISQASLATVTNGPRVAIVGGRRTRQGTGPFIARAFVDCGCTICAVVGTRAESADEAVQSLQRLAGTRVSGYTEFDEMIAAESPDIVALCCPPEHRLPLLRKCADSGLHCYAEKPLWWKPSGTEACIEEASDTAIEVEKIVRNFQRNGGKLGINTQWPATLTAFESLHGRIGNPSTIRQFSMLLGPASTGLSMLIDSLSHPLSMLYALVGVGSITQLRFTPRFNGSDMIAAEFAFDYRADASTVAVTVSLVHSPAQPRPAAYEINGLRIRRHVEPETYLISFAANDRSVTVIDPLLLSVSRFLETLKSDVPVDYDPLIAGMKHLRQLVGAAQSIKSQA